MTRGSQRMAHTPTVLPISIVICLGRMPYEAISDKTDLLLSKSGRVVKLDFGPIVGRGSSLDSHAITCAAHPARETTTINRSIYFILTIGSSFEGRPLSP